MSFRFCLWAVKLRLPIVRHLMLTLAGLSRGLAVLLTGANISPRAEIGPGLVVHTNYGI